MKRIRLITAILLIACVPASSLSADAGAVLSEARAEFYRIESLLISDDLDSARIYFSGSDKSYSEIVRMISSLDLKALTAPERADCLFILLVISLREPQYLSFDKVKLDYLAAIRDNIGQDEVKSALLGHIIYLSEFNYKIAADALVNELASAAGGKDLYRLIGEYAMEKGKPGVAFPFFAKYLSGVYESDGPEKCAEESKKIEEAFRTRGYGYFAGRLETTRFKIALEASAEPSGVINAIKERAASLYRQGSVSEALELYEIAYSAGADAKALITIGDIYFDGGKYELAMRRYQEYPGADENPEILFKIALCNRKMGENTAAYSLFKKIESGYKDSDYYDDAMYYIGTLNKDAGLFEESEKYFEKLRSERPGSEYVTSQ